jgi:hypothetical protein
MIKGKNNLDYTYFNSYLINCGSSNPSDIELLTDFFNEKLNMLPEQKLDSEKLILLNELIIFCRKKFNGSN